LFRVFGGIETIVEAIDDLIHISVNPAVESERKVGFRLAMSRGGCHFEIESSESPIPPPEDFDGGHLRWVDSAARGIERAVFIESETAAEGEKEGEKFDQGDEDPCNGKSGSDGGMTVCGDEQREYAEENCQTGEDDLPYPIAWGGTSRDGHESWSLACPK